MMTFEEHLATGAELEEGIVRTSAITANAARSRRFGDEAVDAFRRGKQALKLGGSDLSVDKRLARLEVAIDELLNGLIKQREQIGAGVAVDVTGHILNSKGSNGR